MSRFFLGIDGGQSSTTCLIGDEQGRVVGVGRAGPCNHVGEALGRARFLAAMGDSLREALQQAGLPARTRFAATCLGLSGGPADKDALARKAIRAAQYRITHDAEIALAGATAGAPGIVAIAGTGAIAFGKNARGQIARAGGWGYIFGDEGGAFHLVRQALRAALRYEEGWGPGAALRDALLAAGKCETAQELLHRFYTDEYSRARVAALAPVVDETARAGDPVALKILKDAAKALASLTAAVRAQLFKEGEMVDVRTVGGVFKSAPVLAKFEVLAEFDGCLVSAPRHGPAAGALLEAYRLAGESPQLENLPEET